MKRCIAVLCVLCFPILATAQVKVKVLGVDLSQDGGSVKVNTGDVRVHVAEDEPEAAQQGQPRAQPQAQPKKTQVKRGAITCKGDQKLTVDGAVIDAKVTIIARDNCQLTVNDSVMNAKEVALRVSGRATVYLNRSTLNATTVIVASDNAVIHSDSSTFQGKVQLRGSSTLSAKSSVINGALITQGEGAFKDQGENVLNGR